MGGGDQVSDFDNTSDFVDFSFVQSNESAIEQAKDEQISDAIRRGYKNIAGSDFPVADKS